MEEKIEQMHKAGKWLLIIGVILLILMFVFLFSATVILVPYTLVLSVLCNGVGFFLVRYKGEKQDK